MTQVAVIGAGVSGLAAALFLARRGHRVDLLERDGGEPAADPQVRFDGWVRRGVPQLRQPHLYLGLSRQILREEAPDVLAALTASGCGEARMMGFAGEDPDGLYMSTVASRVTYEAVLRAAALREPNVTFHAEAAVSGLTRSDAGGTPRVTGVLTEDGRTLAADLVVDASGRWSAGDVWLQAIGARPWQEQTHETTFVYLTRWWRLKPGRAFPDNQTGIRSVMDYAGAFVFPADNGFYSMSLFLSARDPLRGAAAKPEAFDAIMAALPVMAPWLAVGEPVTRPAPLGRINNRLRRLRDDQGLVATGFVLLGDSAIHTNPSLGRGCSLALSHAQRLADMADRASDDPLGFAEDFHGWTEENLAVWFDSQVSADSYRLAQIEAALDGQPPPELPRSSRIGMALADMSAEDPEAFTALQRQAHLFARPKELLENAALSARVEARLARGLPPPPPQPLARAEFERLVAR